MKLLVTIAEGPGIGAGRKTALDMTTERLFSIASVLALLAFAPGLACGAEQEGVAVAIVFDTSGSMQESVRDKAGGWSPKYKIAARALQAVASQLEVYTTNTAGGTQRKLQAGLFIFSGSGAREAIKLGPLNAQELRRWARGFSGPSGGTPLGAAVETASQALLKSGIARKHVLVITDGMNTLGADPARVIPTLNKQAEKAQTKLAFHFIAFDVNAAVFEPVKKLGATVVGASDEKQLNSQLDFILQRKILLEDEEPAKK